MGLASSTQPGLATFLYNKNRHFLLDIPGDGSFNGDLPHLLRAVDAVVFVVDAVDGVKPLTKKLWGEVTKRNLPVIFCINKMDRDRADFDMALAGIESIIPADEVIDAMGQIGRSIPPSLRETSRGGLAVTPTAKNLVSRLGNRKLGSLQGGAG